MSNALPDAAARARRHLAATLGLTEADVLIVTCQHVQWPDACLGMPDPDEMCAEVETPGWSVVLEANGKRYTLRTNERGDRARVEG